MEFGDNDATMSSPYHWVRLLSVIRLRAATFSLHESFVPVLLDALPSAARIPCYLAVLEYYITRCYPADKPICVLQKNKSLSASPTVGVLHPRSMELDNAPRIRHEQVDVLDQMNRASRLTPEQVDMAAG